MLLGLKWLQKSSRHRSRFFVTPVDLLNDFTNLISKDGPGDPFAQVQPLQESCASALRLVLLRGNLLFTSRPAAIPPWAMAT
ncbi:MAG: hypothetical protein DMG42_04270 [Acidobacteria bacterium]|nr:MAG: hypothetical protein DMG42_04270 [Acidobacteriota bacterium]